MLPLRVRFGLLALSLLTLVACTLPPTVFPPRDSRGDRDTVSDPPDAPPDAKKAAGCVNAFAADLYAQLRAGKGNVIVSPYSIGVALAMTRAGAEGNTAGELDAALHIPAWGKTTTGGAFKQMTASVTAAPRAARHRPELSVANSLWLDQGHPWKKEFLAAGREDFRAGLFEANFRGTPEAARASINKWVENQTHDKIKDLMPAGAVDTNTRIVLANAIYFKARWADAFKKEDTKPEEFTLAGGQKVQAPLMYRSGQYRLYENDALQVLKLSYDGKAESMYVLLPRTHDGLPALEQQLDAAKLSEWTTVMNGPGEVRVWLPRFKFTVPTELADVLQKLGVKDAFDPQKADFRGMSDHPQGLFVSRVIHKAFVETDEVGTEAAAATAVTAALGAVAQPLPIPVRNFRADHPFLFVIKHEPTGAVLFMGRVTDPTR